MRFHLRLYKAPRAHYHGALISVMQDLLPSGCGAAPTATENKINVKHTSYSELMSVHLEEERPIRVGNIRLSEDYQFPGPIEMMEVWFIFDIAGLPILELPAHLKTLSYEKQQVEVFKSTILRKEYQPAGDPGNYLFLEGDPTDKEQILRIVAVRPMSELARMAYDDFLSVKRNMN